MEELLKKYLINTFGCQMNAHDSEKLAGIIEQMGYTATDDEKQADLIVFNTCCVRESAENKIYGNIGHLKHLKKTQKDLKIAICGCMTQQDGALERIRAKCSHVDIVFGTFNLHKLPQLLRDNAESGRMVVDIWKDHDETDSGLDGDLSGRIANRTAPHKASVNIIYGCDNYCSYCIVPYVRGRERSRPHWDILAEAAELSADGVKEILLLGQNVNSYNSNDVDFTALLELLATGERFKGIERIRFMTSHPKDMSDVLIDVIASNDKICKHIHLPVQAGSSAVLERMNRGYTKEGYLALIDKIKAKIPNASFTTDIIVGFPGETESDFEDTLDIVRKVRFNGVYTFLYSKRSGTPAADMSGQVPEDTANERFQKLLDVVNPIVFDRNREMVGRAETVLCDSYELKDGVGILTGRTDNNIITHFRGNDELVGETVQVKITEAKPFYLFGYCGSSPQ